MMLYVLLLGECRFGCAMLNGKRRCGYATESFERNAAFDFDVQRPTLRWCFRPSPPSAFWTNGNAGRKHIALMKMEYAAG